MVVHVIVQVEVRSQFQPWKFSFVKCWQEQVGQIFREGRQRQEQRKAEVERKAKIAKRSRGRCFWMNEEKTVLDFSKFIVVQTLRARLSSILHRPKFKGVHNLVPASQLQVPGYVLQHISKGGKFIPTVHRTPLHQLKSGLPALRRSLLLRAFFKDQPLKRPKPSLCKLPSPWSPPSNRSVEQYMRLLEDSLDQFEPKSFQSNWTWIDRKARQWLSQHSTEIAVVDCDKGLGEAIVSQDWLRNQVRRQLAQGYVQCSSGAYFASLSKSKAGVLALVEFFFHSQVISADLRRFLLHKFCQKAAGIFRILVKVHKEPPGSRPVCNLRQTWFTPFAVFLVEQLAPLQQYIPTVILSTDELLEKLDRVKCREGMQLITLDVINLYPSICRSHLLSLIVPFIRAKMSCQRLATFVTKVLEMVLSVVFVEFEGVLYKAEEGIPTGLSVASVLANLYLSHLDSFLQRSLGSELQLVVRYIDDLLLLCAKNDDEIQSLANSWHFSLSFDLSGSCDVHFLDVSLSIHENRTIHWSMFSKPKNLYLYIPAASNHPPSCFVSLQIGGIVRCFRRNKSSKEASKHIEIFKSRLKDRGFSLNWFERLRTKFSLRAKSEASRKGSNVFLKVPYNKDINLKWFKSQLQRHLPLLQQMLPSCSVRPCWSVRKSLFRLRYRGIWKNFDGTGSG